jgi:hypothetical protein
LPIAPKVVKTNKNDDFTGRCFLCLHDYGNLVKHLKKIHFQEWQRNQEVSRKLDEAEEFMKSNTNALKELSEEYWQKLHNEESIENDEELQVCVKYFYIIFLVDGRQNAPIA